MNSMLDAYVFYSDTTNAETTCYNCVSRSKERSIDSTCESPEKMLVPIPCKDYCYVSVILSTTSRYLLEVGGAHKIGYTNGGLDI